MSADKLTFRSNGKLLLTGEYFVLDGAVSLALPCRFGQSMSVRQTGGSSEIKWVSLDHKEQVWFKARFNALDLAVHSTSDSKMSDRLVQIFRAINKQRADFWKQEQYEIHTKLEFPREWGLGTSSTLIANLAEWSEVDPFVLLADTFGGSAYDIACAKANGPILYQKHQYLPPSWLKGNDKRVDGQFVDFAFNPAFKDQLFLVYLGKKQNSRSGIQRYRALIQAERNLTRSISNLTYRIAQASDLNSFEEAILEHERLVSQRLALPMAKDLYFADYWGQVKSLGAWGGDFVLVTSDRSVADTQTYFRSKGFDTILNYNELILYESK